MPALTARYGKPDVIWGVYQFGEAQLPQWREFWRACDGDTAKCLEAAKDMGVSDPHNFVGALHRFLFYMWPGDVDLQKGGFGRQGQAKPKDFLSFMHKIADDHESEPMPKHWYQDLGVTHEQYVGILRAGNVVEPDNEEHLVAYINARIPDLGFKLYSSYLLFRAPRAKATVKKVRESLERVAAKLVAEIEN